MSRSTQDCASAACLSAIGEALTGWLRWCPSVLHLQFTHVADPLLWNDCHGGSSVQVWWVQFTYISLDVHDYPWAIGSRFIYSVKSLSGFIFIHLYVQPAFGQMSSTCITIPFQATALTPTVDVSNVLGFALHSGCAKVLKFSVRKVKQLTAPFACQPYQRLKCRDQDHPTQLQTFNQGS